jgi:hypothetical protein
MYVAGGVFLCNGWCLSFHQPLICNELRIQKGSLIVYMVGGRKHQPRRVIFCEHLPGRKTTENRGYWAFCREQSDLFEYNSYFSFLFSYSM